MTGISSLRGTNLISSIALCGGVVAVTLMVTDRFWLQVITLTLLWAAAGIAWNMPATAGQISLGHSAFTGIGAYTFVLLTIEFDLSPWLGMLLGMFLAAIAAVLIGIPTFRLQGFYFTLATMAFPLILMLLVVHWGHPEESVPFVPGGSLGSMQFMNPRGYVWLALAFFAMTLLIGVWMSKSRFGEILAATKDNETLARSVGIRTLPWKLGAFAISAALCAGVGVIWVNSVLLVVTAEEVFGLSVVILLISVTFVGGIGTPWGPVVGAAVLIPLSQLLTAQIGDRVPGAETLVYGLALILASLLVPKGIVPTIHSAFVRRRAAKQATGTVHTGSAEGPAVTASRMTNPEAVAVQPRRGVHTYGSPILSLQDVAMRFGALRVLEGVSFDVHPGTRVGLIGPNGAGKTTLFNLLTGHLQPSGGQIRFDNSELRGVSAPSRCRRGIARTFQVPLGFASMTPRQNIHIAALGHGLGTNSDAKVREALVKVGLEDRADVALSQLTTFDFKLLELGRALVAGPRLLLLDEPLAGLNKSERKQFFKILAEAVEPETAVVVIEHSVRSLLSYVDELVALDQGRVVAAGNPARVVADEGVIRAYLGSKWSNRGAAPGDVTPDSGGTLNADQAMEAR